MTLEDHWPNGRVAVISPHLDDGVLSCGHLLAARPGSVVMTVFAGRPVSYPALTTWDKQAGFEPGDDVVAIRRTEDRNALAVLGAWPLWLDFPDTQYAAPTPIDVLAGAIERGLDSIDTRLVVAPLGLFHSDHILTHAACLEVLPRRSDLTWRFYADAIYRRRPGLVDDRLGTMRRSNLLTRPLDTPGEQGSALKRQAVECYPSQLQALAHPSVGGYVDAFKPERYWGLV